VAVLDDAPNTVEGRSGNNQGLRAGRLGSRQRRSGTLLPARRLLPGQQPGRPALGKREGAPELFWQEAEKYHVLPLLGGLTTFFGMTPPLPTQSQFTYYGDVQNVASGMIPKIFNHFYTISAVLEIPEGGAEGVIVAEADHLGGFSLFVQDGKLKHTYSFVGVFEFKQESDTPVPAGSVSVRMEFAADEPKPATGGQVTLYINDKPAGGGRMEHTVPVRQPYFVSWPGRSRCCGRVLRVCGTSGSGPGGGGSRCPIGPRVPVAMTVRSRRRAAA
jgi:hypothetical protein